MPQTPMSLGLRHVNSFLSINIHGGHFGFLIIYNRTEDRLQVYYENLHMISSYVEYK